MKSNIGSNDKMIRIIAGFVIIGVGVYYRSWWSLAGVVLILTVLINWCPIYSIFGLNTRNSGPKKKVV